MTQVMKRSSGKPPMKAEKENEIDIISEMNRIICESKTRTEIWVGEEVYEHKICERWTRKAVEERKQDVGWPNESFSSKKEQLELHE